MVLTVIARTALQAASRRRSASAVRPRVASTTPCWTWPHAASDCRRARSDARFRQMAEYVCGGYANSVGGYLRVVLLSDGETVHNAFHDEDYRP